MNREKRKQILKVLNSGWIKVVKMELKNKYDKLIDKTIKEYLKHLNLKLEFHNNNYWIWRGELALITDLKDKREVFIWLEGYNSCYDKQKGDDEK